MEPMIAPSRRAFLASAACLLPRSGEARPAGETIRALVSAEGAGDFPTIQRAVDHVLDRAPAPVSRVILEIRPGVYRERVKIPILSSGTRLRFSTIARFIAAAAVTSPRRAARDRVRPPMLRHSDLKCS